MHRHITIGLGMVASAAFGAAAVQTLHAQTKPPAYNIRRDRNQGPGWI